MPDIKQQVELWKTVVTIGGVVFGAGASLLITVANRGISGGDLEIYGRVLVVGGLLLILLGLAYALRQQGEWRRPPKLPKGFTCTHFPVSNYPDRFPQTPYVQELVIGIRRRTYPPDLRVICSAPIRNMEAKITTIPPTETRSATYYHTSIDGRSLHFSPLEPILPPATLFLIVFSDEPIRVRKVRRLRTQYPTTPSEPSLIAEQSEPGQPT
jgi:hypothetical protein